MITLLCEGILIGISEISDQLETKDIDTIIQFDPQKSRRMKVLKWILYHQYLCIKGIFC